MNNAANEQVLSVGQLFRRSRNALARDFRGLVWVHGEIKSMREQRGSLYLSLVDPGDYADGGDISVDVACWPKRNAVIQGQLRQAGLKLAAGMMVRIEGNVTLSKVGRLQIELTRLDTDALVGRQEAEKRRVIEALTAEGLIDRNRGLGIPLVPLRVGLVSSQDSEGYNDFLGQLQRSPFAFAVTFHHSAVQGPTAAASIARAIADLSDEDLDVIAVCRGGGGELDAFDKDAVVRAIVASPIPVWTGIGHTGDSVLADRVANACFITPTECGQALVRSVGDYVTRINDAAIRISRLSDRALDAQGARLKATGRHLITTVELGMSRTRSDLHRHGERARRCADRDLALSFAAIEGYRKDLLRGAAVANHEALTTLSHFSRRLQAGARGLLANIDRDATLRRSQLSALDPVRQLQRGYSLTRDSNGDLVRDVTDLEIGTVITTQLAGGSAQSTVVAIRPEQETQ